MKRLQPLLAGLTPRETATKLARPDAALNAALTHSPIDRADLIIHIYEAEVARRQSRKTSGIFYTPSRIVAQILDRLPHDGIWLDPAAGAGPFLVGFARRYGLSRLFACDIDAEALDFAALALEAALGTESRGVVEQWRATQAFRCDFLREEWPGPTPDVVFGNPPYGLLAPDELSDAFPLLGGERDLYACFLVRALERVNPGGAVGLLIPDTWLTNVRLAPLRRALADVGLARLADFGKPFPTARDMRVHAVIVQPQAKTCIIESNRNGALEPMRAVSRAELRTSAERGWYPYRTDLEVEACRVIERAPRLGDSFDVIYGLRTGHNERHIGSGTGEYPVVGGQDLDPFDRHVTPRHLVHPDELRPRFERQHGRWKLGVQRIRTNSTHTWRRWLEAAPLEPHEIGLDSLTLISSRTDDDRLWALLGVLSSSVLNRWYRLTFTDVNVKPSYLRELPIPPLEEPLACLVRKRVEAGPSVVLERAIDRLVIDAYGLTPEQAECFEAGYWSERYAEMPLPSREETLALARPQASCIDRTDV